MTFDATRLCSRCSCPSPRAPICDACQALSEPELYTDRRAPVQGDVNTATRRRKGLAVRGPGTISWIEHVRAWRDYAARYGTHQSPERIAERGGFGYDELIDHLGHEPTTWEPSRQ